MDFIDEFKALTKDLPSPDSFKEWSALFICGSITYKRIGLPTHMGILFPNMYLTIVAPPGIGKSVMIDLVKSVIQRRDNLLGANNTTFKGLVDRLQQPNQIKFGANVGIDCIDELSAYFQEAYEQKSIFIANLNTFWMINSDWKESKRGDSTGNNKGHTLKNIFFNMFAATTPKKLKKVIESGDWDSGFGARMLLIYSEIESPPTNILRKTKDNDYSDEIVKLTNKLTEKIKVPEGEKAMLFNYDNGFDAFFENFFMETRELRGVNVMPDAQSYYQRRDTHFLKIAQCYAIARASTTLNEQDALRASNLLKDMERMQTVMYSKAEITTNDEVLTSIWQRFFPMVQMNSSLQFDFSDILRTARYFAYSEQQAMFFANLFVKEWCDAQGEGKYKLRAEKHQNSILKQALSDEENINDQ